MEMHVLNYFLSMIICHLNNVLLIVK
ncbi:hypothetical protein ACMD2_26986 [Ananas comosus]|uniref:Uncharacterized protein n=1 Tax=Ananas comosus TaxID=4615 RepID=A0A199VUQ4_ANACO|nr:hypothetical protein ACMD2_13271 [Ananas comosus]OAY80430.1 hypothetical protein ACMD2_26986 [Ananas comosus]